MHPLILPTLIAVGAAIQVYRALRSGISDGFHLFSRAKDPVNYWLFVSILPLVAVVILAVAISNYVHG
jgi:hypothetical protein